MSAPRSHESLQDAHARIAALEEDLATISASPPPPPTDPIERRIQRVELAGFGVMLVLVVIAVVAALSRDQKRAAQVVHSAPPPALDNTSTLPVGVLTLAPGRIYSGQGPALLDLDGNGTRHIVLMAWRGGHPEAPLYIVALDRRTYEPRFRSGPFPGEWRDRRARILWRNYQLTFVDGDGHEEAIHASTGERTPVGINRTLEDEFRDQCAEDRSRVCLRADRENVKDRLPPNVREKTRFTFEISVAGAADIEHLTIAHELAGNGDWGKHAVAWDEDSTGRRTPRWASLLVPKTQREWPYSNVSPNEWYALAAERFYYVYQSVQGPYRMSALGIKKGELVYDVGLPLEYGSFVESFTADGDDVFLVANESLYAIDGRTGAVAKRLTRF